MSARNVGYAVASFAVVLTAARLVAAHAFQPCVLDIRDAGAGRYEISWRSSSPGADATAQGVQLEPVFPAHCHRAQSTSTGAAAAARFGLECGEKGLSGQAIWVTGLEGARVDAVIRFTDLDGAPFTGVVRAGAPSLSLPDRAAAASGFSAQLALARSYFGAGMGHIAGGYDHLLFVLCLVLLEKRTWALVRTITAFTLAHSVTLGLAVLGVVRVPSAPVEAVIALSLVVLAAELVRAKREPDAAQPTRRQWKMALAFGLLHGLGFAGALTELGLPREGIPVALAMFNLGVEAGQLVFVALVLAASLLLRRFTQRRPGWLSQVPAYAIGALSAFWCIERIAKLWT